MTYGAARSTSDSVEGVTATRFSLLLESTGARDTNVSREGLVKETGLPERGMHRILQQPEGAGVLVGQSDGRHYGPRRRLGKPAGNLLPKATQDGARGVVPRALVDEVGETCNMAALCGDEVPYLNRVGTSDPPRFSLDSGTHVLLHGTSSPHRRQRPGLPGDPTAGLIRGDAKPPRWLSCPSPSGPEHVTRPTCATKFSASQPAYGTVAGPDGPPTDQPTPVGATSRCFSCRRLR